MGTILNISLAGIKDMLRDSSIVRALRHFGIDPVIAFGIGAILIGLVGIVLLMLFFMRKGELQEQETEASEAEDKQAKRKEAKQKKANQKRAKKEEAKRKETKQQKAKKKEAKRREAEQRKAKRREAKKEKARRKEVKRKQTEKEKAGQKEAKKKEVGRKEIEGKKSSEQQADKNYEIITDRIKRVQKKYKSILFAAPNLASLPVTIPVNVAIQLAEQGKRCLLVDLDLRRDAIAKAFEVGTEGSENSLRVRAFQTGVKNLWVLPAHSFARLKQMNIKPIVTKALEKFDFVFINAPCLAASLDRKQIASAAQAAIIFSKSVAEATSLAQLMKSSNCALIASIQTPRGQAS